MKRRNVACLFVCFIILIVSAACRAESPGPDSTTRPAAAASPTPTADSAAIDPLITSLTAAGAEVTNNGRTTQGLFPGDNIYLWQLTINGINVNVFEFRDTAARQAVSDNIVPNGYEYVVTEGDTTVTTHWDGEGTPRFWALDNLIINYWGEDTTVINTLNAVLGGPFADGSRPYRPEAGSGAIAGIGQYGISFQYDPYLAANLSWEVTPERPSTGPDDFGFDVMPAHITFTLLNTYAEDWTLFRQTVNAPDQPQIIIYPLDAYAEMNVMAQEQIAALDDLLAERPHLPGGALPHLPPPNGQQDLQAQMTYLAFQNGTGVRYLTQFNQEPRQINNQEIYYTFQGITADRAYYVAVFFPVVTAVLSDKMAVEDWEAFSANYAAYLLETTAVLNQLSSAEFTPALTLLDAVVTSLRVEPDSTLFVGTLP